MAIEVYKIVHKESPSYLHDLIKIKDTKYCFRYDNITEIPSVRTTRYGLKSFRYAAAKLWNELPNHFRTQTSFNQLKNLINSWNGNSCRCNACCQYNFFQYRHCMKFTLLLLSCFCMLFSLTLFYFIFLFQCLAILHEYFWNIFKICFRVCFRKYINILLCMLFN